MNLQKNLKEVQKLDISKEARERQNLGGKLNAKAIPPRVGDLCAPSPIRMGVDLHGVHNLKSAVFCRSGNLLVDEEVPNFPGIVDKDGQRVASELVEERIFLRVIIEPVEPVVEELKPRGNAEPCENNFLDQVGVGASNPEMIFGFTTVVA